MKALKRVLAITAVALAASLSAGVHAQSAAGATATAADMTEAEVRKVDKDSKKITLKHGAIKNLDMPPMTMVFQVSDPAMLDKVQAGDKVRFTASGEGGRFMVTEIQPVK